MELSIITPHIEALVFASDKPISIAELTDLINNALSFMDDKATTEEVSQALETIGEKYNNELHSFELKESGGGFQFLTKPAYYKTVALLHGDKYLKRLSTAALETLAIVAYRQPVTKGEIEHIRGVNCDYAVQKLLEKELVSIIGRREGSPGQPLEYAASRGFMDYFGVNSLDELPKLNDLFPQDTTEATTVTEAHPVEEDLEEETNTHMVVNESGDVVELPEDAKPDEERPGEENPDDEIPGEEEPEGEQQLDEQKLNEQKSDVEEPDEEEPDEQKFNEESDIEKLDVEEPDEEEPDEEELDVEELDEEEPEEKKPDIENAGVEEPDEQPEEK